MDSRYLMILALLIACDPKEATEDTAEEADADTDSDTDSDTDADADTDTDSDSDLTLLHDDYVGETTLWYTSLWTGTITSGVVDVTVDYAEAIDLGDPYCTATLDLTGVTAPKDCAPCEGADWAYVFESAILESEGSCLYGFGAAAPGIGDEFWTAFFAHFTDYEDWGDTYDELVRLGYYEADGGWGSYTLYEDIGGEIEEMGWDTTGALDADMGVGFTTVTLYEDCGLKLQEGSSESFMTDAAMDGEVDDDLFDIYSIDAEAGQVLKASLDTPDDDSDPEFYIIDPAGCLIASIDDSWDCSNGSGDCPSVELEVTMSGTWIIAVGSWSHFDHRYSIDARVE